jgi:sarcosine oxidase subunit beta
MKTADVIIIGAGINGTSTAFHLARAGVKNVVVVERAYLASGSTGKSGALVRTNYGNAAETQLAAESLNYFKHWKELVGGDCGYQPVGLLYFTAPAYHAELEANIAMHRSFGVNTQIITAQEALELDPSLYVDDITHAVYEADSGFADPNATTFSFAQAAQQLGVEFLFETTATRILTAGKQVTGVETTRGSISAPVVVVIAGAWANQLFAPLAIDLGVVPRRAQISIFRWPHDRSTQHHIYIDRIHPMWVRPIDGNCSLVGVDQDGFELEAGNPDAYDESVSQDYIQLCRNTLSKRFPAMQHSSMRGNWACMLMESPDAHPIIDALQPYTGLFCMTGDSGTSFKTGPAIGKCLSEWITEGQAHTVDLTPFRATRFAEGKPWQDDFTYGVSPSTVAR